MWKYDPSTNTWTQVANFGGTPRREAAAFGIDDFGYVGTGLDNTYTLKKDFWKYDPATNSWSQIANFGGTARKQAVSFNMGGQGYVGTGDDGSFTKDFWQYEPITNTWLQRADFAGTPRYNAAGFGIFPNAYIGTGYDNTLSYKNDFWEYNYFSNSWQQVSDFPSSPRAGATAFSIGNIGYVGTGFDGQPVDDFYAYTPLLSVEENNNVSVRAFPNPTVNELTITSTKNIKSIQVYTVEGKSVFTQSFNNNLQQINIDCSNFVDGIYLYSLSYDNNLSASGKFMVQK